MPTMVNYLVIAQQLHFSWYTCNNYSRLVLNKFMTLFRAFVTDRFRGFIGSFFSRRVSVSVLMWVWRERALNCLNDCLMSFIASLLLYDVFFNGYDKQTKMTLSPTISQSCTGASLCSSVLCWEFYFLTCLTKRHICWPLVRRKPHGNALQCVDCCRWHIDDVGGPVGRDCKVPASSLGVHSRTSAV